MGVCPKWQKRGIGFGLLQHLVSSVAGSEAGRPGASCITLEVRESNVGARSFYEKFGFRSVAIRKDYYQDGENAILMKYHIGGEGGIAGDPL